MTTESPGLKQEFCIYCGKRHESWCSSYDAAQEEMPERRYGKLEERMLDHRYGKLVSKELFVQEPQNKVENALYGLGGEVGEIMDLHKKDLFHPTAVPNFLGQLRKEIGDVLFYLALLNEVYFADSLQDVARDNIRKLQERWPDRYEKYDIERIVL